MKIVDYSLAAHNTVSEKITWRFNNCPTCIAYAVQGSRYSGWEAPWKLTDKPPNMFDTIKAKIKKHNIDHPTHGIGCICMDTYARQIRNAVRTRDGELRSRLIYILTMASRNW
jgi:hypothetical protein